MAIVEFVNKRNRSYVGLKKVIHYALRDDKAIDKIITGIGLNPDNAYNEMVALKNVMGKKDGRLWYHFVQSFPPYDSVTPEIALEIALKTAEYWKDEYQMLIAVHQDKDHIHTHFVMNTVNVVTGLKYTQDNEHRLEIQALSDKICEEYGLHTLSEEQKNNRKYKKPGEYRAEQKGLSWKAELRRTIDFALQYAKSREHFIKLMNAQGYKVKWEEARKNITFTTPSGMKCRDRKLGEPEYYSKQNFEMIFEQNARFDDSAELPQAFKLMENITGIFNGSKADEDTPFNFLHIDFDGLTKNEIENLIHWLEWRVKSKKALEEWEANSKKLNYDFDSLIKLIEMGMNYIGKSNGYDYSYYNGYEV